MIHSIGHSTLSEEQFIKSLRGVSTVVDIRSHPSSKWPQFRKESLETWLPAAGVKYEWEPRLGGWTENHMGFASQMLTHGVDIACYSRGKFPKQRIAKNTQVDPNKPAWTNVGLYDFSWFMSLNEFIEAAEELISRTDDVAIMCCEGPWFKCHRSMVADYIAFRGHDVRHLPGKKTHTQSLGNRLDRYDPEILKSWKDFNGSKIL